VFAMPVDTPELPVPEMVVPVDPPAVVARISSHESSSGEENYFGCHNEKESEKPYLGEVIEGEPAAAQEAHVQLAEVQEGEEEVNPMSTAEIPEGELRKEETLVTATPTTEDGSPVCEHSGSMTMAPACSEEIVDSSSNEGATTPLTDDAHPCVVLAPSSPAPSVTGTVDSEDDGVLEEDNNNNNNTPLPLSIIQKLEALKEIDAPDNRNSKPLEKDLLDLVFERAELFLCATCISSTAQVPEQKSNERDLLDDVFERVDIFENASRVVTNFQTSPNRKPTIPVIPEHDVLDDFFESTEQIIRNFSDTPVKTNSKPQLRAKKSGPYRPDLLDLFFESAEKLSISPQSGHGLEMEENGEELTTEIIPTTSKTTQNEASQEDAASSNQPDLLDQFFESAEVLVERGCSDAKTAQCANS
jgi:hypothetical protein